MPEFFLHNPKAICDGPQQGEGLGCHPRQLIKERRWMVWLDMISGRFVHLVALLAAPEHTGKGLLPAQKQSSKCLTRRAPEVACQVLSSTEPRYLVISQSHPDIGAPNSQLRVANS